VAAKMRSIKECNNLIVPHHAMLLCVSLLVSLLHMDLGTATFGVLLLLNDFFHLELIVIEFVV
jgi:hypothetical protein